MIIHLAGHNNQFIPCEILVCVLITGMIDQGKVRINRWANWSEIKVIHSIIDCNIHRPNLVVKHPELFVNIEAIRALSHAVRVELEAEQELHHHPSYHDLTVRQDGANTGLGLAKEPGKLEDSQVTDGADQEPPKPTVWDFVLVRYQVPDSVGRCEVGGVHIEVFPCLLLFAVPGQRVASDDLSESWW